jgi:hypothetical protein
VEILQGATYSKNRSENFKTTLRTGEITAQFLLILLQYPFTTILSPLIKKRELGAKSGKLKQSFKQAHIEKKVQRAGSTRETAASRS